VRIGDLIANAGIVADVPIFRSPDLGGTGMISVARVLEAVRPHALVGIDPGSLSEISVTRASRTVPGADVEAAISASIAARYSLGASKELTLYLDRPLRGIHVEPNSTTVPRVERLNYDPRSGRFEAAVEIAGPPAQQLRVVGVAIVTAPVATLTRAIGRGEVIKPADVTIERRPRSEIGADTLGDAQSAIGLAARAPLAAGRVLRSVELMKPELISRNDTVTLIYEIPGVTVTARGKAMESGAEGDVIEVATQHAKRTVHGVVVASGRVVISQTSPRAVARAEPRVSPLNPVSAQKGAQ
jgi:flagella basal body P-ring formation protein FlgA